MKETLTLLQDSLNRILKTNIFKIEEIVFEETEIIRLTAGNKVLLSTRIESRKLTDKEVYYNTELFIKELLKSLIFGLPINGVKDTWGNEVQSITNIIIQEYLYNYIKENINPQTDKLVSIKIEGNKVNITKTVEPSNIGFEKYTLELTIKNIYKINKAIKKINKFFK